MVHCLWIYKQGISVYASILHSLLDFFRIYYQLSHLCAFSKLIIPVSRYMASSQPCVRGSHKFRKLWWKSRRSLNTCCSKKIVLLLAATLSSWTAFFNFSKCTMIKVIDYSMPQAFTMVSMLVSKLLAPLIGWLADVKLGRYETIKFASLFSFIANVLIFFAFINESEGAFKIIASIALAIASVCFTCV